MSERLTLGAGLAAAVADQPLALPAWHPTTAGGLLLTLDVSDGLVDSASVRIGWVHRGAEKLLEHREYRALPSLASRHEWHSGVANEIAMACAVERLLGLPVPDRAAWLRVLATELTRIAHHAAFLGWLQLRERCAVAVETLTGGRMHPSYARIGGVAEDLPEGFGAELDAVTGLLEACETPTGGEGLGGCDGAVCAGHGLLGVHARAAGVARDLRLGGGCVSPDAYAELFAPGGPGRVVVAGSGDGGAGDVAARRRVLAEECAVSLDLARACLHRLADLGPGPVDQRLPKVVRAPEDEVLVLHEAPGGVAGFAVAAMGAREPWRVRIVAPSLGAAAALEAILPGTPLDQVADVVGSMLVVAGDSDR